MPTPQFFAAQRRMLAGLAAGSRHPGGGFGWLDEASRLEPDRTVETFISCRMTHVLALAERHDGAPTGELVEHGLDALAANGLLHDDEHGGWFAAADPAAPHGTTKRAYEHAFVLLAGCSALAAGHERARAVVDEALSVLDEHFFDPATGLYRDVLERDWRHREAYLGANSNMHLTEALLTAYDVGVGEWARDRALGLARRVVHEIAVASGYRLPEHYGPDGAVRLDYSRSRPDHPFRPYGVTIGHQLEWARLLVHLRHAGGAAAPGWLLADAEALFEKAVCDGWAVDGAEGFVYTVDFTGAPVVRQRLHWVVAEAINAAQVLDEVGSAADYGRWRDLWWQHALDHFVDADGSWRHELAPDLTPATSIWSGRPDVYHAYQAVLLASVGPAASFAAPDRSSTD